MGLNKYVAGVEDFAACIDANRLSLVWLVPASWAINSYFLARITENPSLLEFLTFAGAYSAGFTFCGLIFALLSAIDTYKAFKETERRIVQGKLEGEFVKNLSYFFEHKIGMEVACRKWGFEQRLRDIYNEKT